MSPCSHSLPRLSHYLLFLFVQIIPLTRAPAIITRMLRLLWMASTYQEHLSFCIECALRKRIYGIRNFDLCDFPFT